MNCLAKWYRYASLFKLLRDFLRLGRKVTMMNKKQTSVGRFLKSISFLRSFRDRPGFLCLGPPPILRPAQAIFWYIDIHSIQVCNQSRGLHKGGSEAGQVGRRQNGRHIGVVHVRHRHLCLHYGRIPAKKAEHAASFLFKVCKKCYLVEVYFFLFTKTAIWFKSR